MESMSFLRTLGVVLSLLSLMVFAARRRKHFLGRLEFLVAGLMAGVGIVGLFPSSVNFLVRLTGFTGELGRITSLLAFTVLVLSALVFVILGQLSEFQHKFHRYMAHVAIDQMMGTFRAPTPLQLAIVMPAYNEALNLAEILKQAPRRVLSLSTQVIVVDDGSDDNSGEVAAAMGAYVVRSPLNCGGGYALQVGFLAAKRLGATYVVTMDADGQHRFEDLATVVQALTDGGADLVVGSRHLGASVGHETVRALGLRLFNVLISNLVGRRITDCASGFRGMRISCLSALHLVQRRHHTAEMLIEASRRHFHIREVPITIVPRISGVSKKGVNWLYGLRFFNTIVSSWWRR